DLTEHLRPGEQALRLEEPTGTQPAYSVTFRYHVPGADAPKPGGLAVELAYPKKDLAVRETVGVKATGRNRGPAPVPMVMLELPVPPGCAPLADDLDELVAKGKIDKYERNGRSILVYLRSVSPDGPTELAYRLRAASPVKVAVPGAR